MAEPPSRSYLEIQEPEPLKQTVATAKKTNFCFKTLDLRRAVLVLASAALVLSFATAVSPDLLTRWRVAPRVRAAMEAVDIEVPPDWNVRYGLFRTCVAKDGGDYASHCVGTPGLVRLGQDNADGKGVASVLLQVLYVAGLACQVGGVLAAAVALFHPKGSCPRHGLPDSLASRDMRTVVNGLAILNALASLLHVIALFSLMLSSDRFYRGCKVLKFEGFPEFSGIDGILLSYGWSFVAAWLGAAFSATTLFLNLLDLMFMPLGFCGPGGYFDPDWELGAKLELDKVERIVREHQRQPV